MASRSTHSQGTPGRSKPRRPKVARSPITSEAEREQTLRNYKVTIEYKHLKQHAPSGVYVIPSFDDLRFFHGVIFLRRGLYHNGIFKFQIHLPDEYNNVNAWPQIIFTSQVYNPHVDPETGELDVRTPYPQWDPQRHYLVTVLTYLKKIFYMKTPTGYENATANTDARDLARSNPAAFRKKIEACVRQSKTSVYVNDPGCTVKFTEETACHEILREVMKEKFCSKQDQTSGTPGSASKSKKGGGLVPSEDISTRVTRGKILECVQQAQAIADKRQEEEDKEAS